MNNLLIDSHAHLDRESFGDELESVIQRAREAGLTNIINIGAGGNTEVFDKAISLAEKNNDIYTTIGIHPHNAKDANIELYKTLEQRLNHQKVVGLGEIGLDYYYNFAPRAVQEETFRCQLEIAKKVKLPVVIHCRETHSDCKKILQQYSSEISGVIHCFSGDINDAKQYIEMGFYISIPGVITFKNAKKIIEVVNNIDIKYMLIETDSPYLTPEPFRGKRNEPAYVLYVAKKIAEIKGIAISDVAKITSENTKKLFNFL